MNESGLLPLSLDAQNLTQQSALQLLQKTEKLTKRLGLALHGEQDQQCSIGEVMLGNRTSSAQQVKCILLWFLFYESKKDQN